MKKIYGIVLNLLLLTLHHYIDATKAYVANDSGNSVSVFDTVTNTVIDVIQSSNIVSPVAIALTPDGKRAYLVNNGNGSTNLGSVTVIDVATDTIIQQVTDLSTPTFNEPSDIAITPNGKFAYVVNETGSVSGSVSVINIASNSVIQQITDASFDTPFGIAITPDGTTAYVTNAAGNSVTIINLASNSVQGTVSGANFNEPVFIAITPDGTTAYVTNTIGNSVSIINLATNTVTGVVTDIGTFNQPYAIAITPNGKIAYVTNIGGNGSISVIDLTVNKVIGTVSNLPTPSGSTALAFTQDGTVAYIIDQRTNQVHIAVVATNTIQGNVTDRTPATFNAPDFIVIVPPPTITATQKKNIFLTQTDYVNIITWGVPTFIVPVTYSIYRDATLTDLAGTIPATASPIFQDHNRNPQVTDTYYIVAKNEAGIALQIDSVTVPVKK